MNEPLSLRSYPLKLRILGVVAASTWLLLPMLLLLVTDYEQAIWAIRFVLLAGPLVAATGAWLMKRIGLSEARLIALMPIPFHWFISTLMFVVGSWLPAIVYAAAGALGVSAFLVLWKKDAIRESIRKTPGARLGQVSAGLLIACFILFWPLNFLIDFQTGEIFESRVLESSVSRGCSITFGPWRNQLATEHFHSGSAGFCDHLYPGQNVRVELAPGILRSPWIRSVRPISTNSEVLESFYTAWSERREAERNMPRDPPSVLAVFLIAAALPALYIAGALLQHWIRRA